MTITHEYGIERAKKWLYVASEHRYRGNDEKAIRATKKAEYWLNEASKSFFHNLPPEEKEELGRIREDLLKSVRTMSKNMEALSGI